jgi:hypothetical protein
VDRPRYEKGTVIHVRTVHSTTVTGPPVPTIRPGELAGDYFAGEVPVNARQATPYGVFWAIALFVIQCVWLSLVLRYPGLGSGDPAAVNDRVVASWLPVFLLACAAAPLAALALAADRDYPDPYGEGVTFGHPVGVAACTAVGVGLVAVAAVAYSATQGPHTAVTIAVGCAAVLATVIGTAAGLVTVYRPALRAPACWAILAIWVGLTLRQVFLWAVGQHDAVHTVGHVDVTGSAPALLAFGVAVTALVGGVAGFLHTRGLAPLLASVGALWLCATCTSSVGLGTSALTDAPWRIIAWSLVGAVAGVVTLAIRWWWQDDH